MLTILSRLMDDLAARHGSFQRAGEAGDLGFGARSRLIIPAKQLIGPGSFGRVTG